MIPWLSKDDIGGTQEHEFYVQPLTYEVLILFGKCRHNGDDQ